MPLRLFSTSTFRLSVAYMGIFAGSVLVLMGFLYWATVGYMQGQTDATIEVEIEGLADVYKRDGLNGLVGVIRDRISRDPARSSIYLLADQNYKPLVGNLDRWPASAADSAGWLEFQLHDPVSASGQRARGRPFRLRGGLNLLVGRDVNELSAMTALIERALVWGLVITLLLGFAGGAFFSLRSLRRLESIKLTSQRVMDGDLSQRVPVSGSRDDIDRLAQNLNSMLDRLEHSMAGIQHVSDNIAHDLKTPLTRLRNRLTAFLASGDQRKLKTDRIAGCIEEVDGLLDTFDGLLRIARLEARGNHTGFMSIELGEVLKTACEFYEAVAEQRNLRLIVEIDPVDVRGDENLLVQAICNVLDNAIKYSPDGSTIHVTLERRGECARLAIADRGPGISHAEQDLVFDRFYRGDHSRGTPGSGLGLSLVKAIFDCHEASVVLADNNPGLCFIAEIPRVKCDISDAA